MATSRDEKSAADGNNEINAFTAAEIYVLEQIKLLTLDYIEELERKIADLYQQMMNAHRHNGKPVTLKEMRKFRKIEQNKLHKKEALEFILGLAKNLLMICEQQLPADGSDWRQSFWENFDVLMNKQKRILTINRIGWKGMIGIGYSDTAQLTNAYFANIYQIKAGLKEEFSACLESLGPPTELGKALLETTLKARLRLQVKMANIDLETSPMEPDFRKENKEQKIKILEALSDATYNFLNVLYEDLNDAQLAEKADIFLVSMNTYLEQSRSIKSIGYKSAIKNMFFMAPAKSNTTLLIEDVVTEFKSTLALRPQIVGQLTP